MPIDQKDITVVLPNPVYYGKQGVIKVGDKFVAVCKDCGKEVEFHVTKVGKTIVAKCKDAGHSMKISIKKRLGFK